MWHTYMHTIKYTFMRAPTHTHTHTDKHRHTHTDTHTHVVSHSLCYHKRENIRWAKFSQISVFKSTTKVFP